MVDVDFEKKYGFQEENPVKKIKPTTDFEKKYGFQEEEEPGWKSAMRYGAAVGQPLAMIAAGAPNAAMEIATTQEPEPTFQLAEEEEFGGPWGSPVFQMLKAKGLSDQEIADLFQQAQQGYQESSQQAAKFKPSVSGAFSTAEEMGLPVEPKTTGQKALQTASYLAMLGKGGKPTNPLTPFQLGKTGIGMAGYEGLQHGAGLSPEAAQLITLAGVEPGAQALQQDLATSISPRGAPSITDRVNIQDRLFAPGEKLFAKPIRPVKVGKVGEETPEFTETKNLETRTGRQIGEDILKRATETKTRAPGGRELPLPTMERPKTGRQVAVTSKQPEGFNYQREATAELGRERLQEQGPSEALREARRSVEPEERLGETITRNKIPNPAEAGKTAQQVLQNRSNEVYGDVNAAFDRSTQLNQNITGERPELLSRLRARRDKIERQGARKLDAQAMDLLDDMISFLEQGAVTNQDLIDRNRNFRKYTQYEYAHDAKNIFKPIISDVDRDIMSTAEGNPEAVQSYSEALNANRQWEEKYNNDYIRPFLSTENRSYEGMYNSLMNEDTFNVLSPILEEGDALGIRTAEGIKRDIIEKNLRPLIYNKDGTLNTNAANSRAFRDKINSMTVRTTPAERRALVQEAKSWKMRGGRKVKEVTPKKEWWQDTIAEDMEKEVDSIKGIQKVEKLFSKPEDAEFLKQVKVDAGINRLRHGKIKGDKQTIAAVLENADNVEYLEHTLGKKTVREWQKTIAQQERYETQLKDYEKQLDALEKRNAKEASEATKASIKEKKENIKKSKAKILAQKQVVHFIMDQIPVVQNAPYVFKQAVIDHLVD